LIDTVENCFGKKEKIVRPMIVLSLAILSVFGKQVFLLLSGVEDVDFTNWNTAVSGLNCFLSGLGDVVGSEDGEGGKNANDDYKEKIPLFFV